MSKGQALVQAHNTNAQHENTTHALETSATQALETSAKQAQNKHTTDKTV
jgi:hypothetical protein